MTVSDRLGVLLARVTGADEDARAAARQRWDALAKPPGALGALEDLGTRLAGIAGRCPPPVPSAPALVVCAGDHGVHAQGVTPWPRDITGLMVATIGRDAAAANAIARASGTEVHVLDVGVATDVPDHPRLHRRRVRAGTRDLSVEDAMTAGECAQAVLAGAEVAEQLVDDGADLLVTGDLGIANTTPSATLIAAYTGAEAATATGRGTGIDDTMLDRKRKVVDDALRRWRAAGDPGPLATLAALGGFEHAAIVGVALAGAARRVPVVLDGVIADAAALAAVALCPPAVDALVAGHASAEPGARLALGHLGLRPLLDLDLRLGEGTGALLAVPLLQAAARALGQMATLADLGVEEG